jgi:hypothetical protein
MIHQTLNLQTINTKQSIQGITDEKIQTLRIAAGFICANSTSHGTAYYSWHNCKQ